jgi:hypothetical protein
MNRRKKLMQELKKKTKTKNAKLQPNTKKVYISKAERAKTAAQAELSPPPLHHYSNITLAHTTHGIPLSRQL